MNERHIYADVEKPFHFWVREGKRWILRDGADHLRDGAQQGNSHTGNGHPSQGPGAGKA